MSYTQSLFRPISNQTRTRKGTVLAYLVSWESDINHTRDIYRCYIQDWTLKFCENFYVSQTQRRVNAFHYVLDYNLPPNARFVWLCHIVTQPYSARRRLHLCLLSCKNSSDRDNPGTRPYSLAQRYEVFLIHTELLSINVRSAFAHRVCGNQNPCSQCHFADRLEKLAAHAPPSCG